LFCAPKKYRLTAAQFLEEFASIPQERRRIQTVRDAWREIVMRRFPC
jgi:flagellin-specific chaperone FliS